SSRCCPRCYRSRGRPTLSTVRPGSGMGLRDHAETPGGIVDPLHVQRVLVRCALLLCLARPTLVTAIDAAPGEKTQHAPPTQVIKSVGGDFDVLQKRRVIRVLVVYNKTHFFIDKGQPRGLTYEAFKLFEDELNKKYKTGNMKIHVVFIPVGRAQLEQALLTGRGDIAVASLTVTPERLEK